MYKRVSVNILNYNGKHFLKDCINSVLTQDYPNFIINVIDNNSSDKSLDFLKKNYSSLLKSKKIKIFPLKKNYGFTGAYNKIYKKDKSPYFLLLNNDIIIKDRSLITKIVIPLKNNKIGSVGVLDKPFFFDKKQKLLQGNLSILYTISFQKEIDKFVSFSGGVCCVIKREILKNLFDEDYFAYCEDSYLGVKLLIKGYLNECIKNTEILHYGSGTSKKGSFFIRYNSEKNRIMNFLLFYDLKTILKLLPLFFFHLIVQDLFYLFKPKILGGLIKAHFYIIKNFDKILKKRELIQREKKILDNNLFKFFSYKIFTEEFYTSSIKSLNLKRYKFIYSSLARFLNFFSFVYCKIFKIKVKEFLQ